MSILVLNEYLFNVYLFIPCDKKFFITTNIGMLQILQSHSLEKRKITKDSQRGQPMAPITIHWRGWQYIGLHGHRWSSIIMRGDSIVMKD